MVVKAATKFTPAVYEKYEWGAFRHPRHFIGVVAFITICLIIDCNNFFLKALLWIPPDHEIMKFRIAVWGFCAIATAKEWHEFISNDYCHRLGAFAWMAFYTCGIEFLAVVKFGLAVNLFKWDVFPWYVGVIWISFAVMFIGGLTLSWINKVAAEKAGVEMPKFNPYNPEPEITSHAKKN